VKAKFVNVIPATLIVAIKEAYNEQLEKREPA